MATTATVLETSFPDLQLVRRGKVRDVYAVTGEQLLVVATDRISAFDCISPTPIPRKGEVLTALSKFWFERLAGIVPNHLLTTEIEEMPQVVAQYAEDLRGRSMLVRRAEVFPVECVVRGYLSGSGWKDYLGTGEVCGHRLPAGLLESEQLPEPIFTPATKAEEGHDENISEERMSDIVGLETMRRLRDISLELYAQASLYARSRGIIIADTKFEFGRDKDGTIILIDEVMTPDSSRFWPADDYRPGGAQPSFDKQFVRDWLDSPEAGWDRHQSGTQPPELPGWVVERTRALYITAFERITGECWA